MLLPVVVLWALLGGYATTSESAAIAALYALIVQRFVHRDLASFRDIVRVAGDCVAVVGGVLVILSVAVGLTNYLVNALMQLIEWTQSTIEVEGAVPASAQRGPLTFDLRSPRAAGTRAKGRFPPIRPQERCYHHAVIYPIQVRSHL